MIKLTDKEIRNLKSNSSLAEPIGGRGAGTLLLRNRFGIIEAYYRYFYQKKKVHLKVGFYKAGKNSGLTLAEIRNKTIDLSRTRNEHPDLKNFLEIENKKQELELKLQKENLEKESLKGTLEELFNSYIKHLINNKKSSFKDVERYFNVDVFIYFPEFKTIKACDIKTDDIIKILSFHIQRGVKAGVNRLRSHLLAAFNYGMKVDNDPRHIASDGKLFRITSNPVTPIPKQSDYEKVIDRILTLEEVKHFWHHFQYVENINPLIVALVHFLFATGGQRPKQLLRSQWLDYDLSKRTLNIVDSKGKGNTREYLTPLTSRAINLLKQLPTEDYSHPFTTTGKTPIRVETIQKAIRKYYTQFDVSPFSLRDIRRTCKNLMIDAGVDREKRNLIQNHGLIGVDFKHYDKSDHLPEKINGFTKYDLLLNKIISDL